MSSVTAYYCDKCECEIMSDRTEMTVESGPLHGRMECVDMCERCIREFETWLQTPPAARPPDPAFARPPASAATPRAS